MPEMYTAPPIAPSRREPAPNDEGGGLTDEAGQRAKEVAAQAQDKLQSTAGQVQTRVREQLNDRSTHVGSEIAQRASDLRSVGETLRERGEDGPARAADQLAGYVERAGGYLRENDADRFLADLEDLGRRQPMAIAAGGLALGYMASRFLKASGRSRYRGLTVERPAGVYPPPNGGSPLGGGDMPATGAPPATRVYPPVGGGSPLGGEDIPATGAPAATRGLR